LETIAWGDPNVIYATIVSKDILITDGNPVYRDGQGHLGTVKCRERERRPKYAASYPHFLPLSLSLPSS
jgi:hypothetical protein